jgi:hypothetical protein
LSTIWQRRKILNTFEGITSTIEVVPVKNIIMRLRTADCNGEG